MGVFFLSTLTPSFPPSPLPARCLTVELVAPTQHHHTTLLGTGNRFKARWCSAEPACERKSLWLCFHATVLAPRAPAVSRKEISLSALFSGAQLPLCGQGGLTVSMLSKVR